jgi:hypothetical protein
VLVRWKPIVWSQADHYAQWLTYPTRVGEAPEQGSELMLAEQPIDTFFATRVETGAERCWFGSNLWSKTGGAVARCT